MISQPQSQQPEIPRKFTSGFFTLLANIVELEAKNKVAPKTEANDEMDTRARQVINELTPFGHQSILTKKGPVKTLSGVVPRETRDSVRERFMNRDQVERDEINARI